MKLKVQIIKHFSLNRVQKAGAIFDIKKLNWMNSYYIKNYQTKELYSFLLKLSLVSEDVDVNKYYKAIDYAKNSAVTLHELSDKIIIFFKEDNYNELLKKYLSPFKFFK